MCPRPATGTLNAMAQTKRHGTNKGASTMTAQPHLPPNPLPPPPVKLPPRVVLTAGTTSVTIDGGASVTIDCTADRVNTGAAISLSAGQLPQGVTAVFSPSSLPASAAAQQFTLTLTAAPTAASAESAVQVIATAAGAASGEATIAVSVFTPSPPFVSALSPSTGSVPAFLQPGTSVTVTGGGFAPGTVVAFGQDSPAAPVSIAGDGMSLLATVPATGASGPLTVTCPSGQAAAGPDFAVDNYRNTRGLSWANTPEFQSLVGGTYSAGDATALFGESATYLDILGVEILNPLVSVFLGVADSALDSGGQCFGMSLASLRFAARQMSFAGLPQQAAPAEPDGPAGPDAWLLDGPALGAGSDVSPSLAAYVHQQHLAQLSNENINNWIGFHVGVTTAAELLSVLQQALTAGLGAIVCLNPSISEGHAVVVYQITETGGGAFDILVYNPNVPFQPGEDTDPVFRAGQAAQSVISVQSDGSWSFSELDWTGGIYGITVVPWNTIPATPTLPWALLEAGTLAAAVLLLITGDAAVTQVSDGQGHYLLSGGQRNTDAATALPGVRPLPAFGGLGATLPPVFASISPATLTHTVTGQAAGSYDLYWVGAAHSVTMTAVPTTPGADDSVQVVPGGVSFTPAADKAIAVTVTGIGSASGLPRTATLRTGATAGASAGLSFDTAAETFSYLNAGVPGTYTLDLSTVGADGQTVSIAPPVPSAGPGGTLTFSPVWNPSH
jgi:hypothetical protein